MKRRLMQDTGIDEHTLFLAHFDGDFKDEVSGQVMQKDGSNAPIITSSDKKFGSGSVSGNATSEVNDSQVLRAPNVDYNITKEITIEFWMKVRTRKYSGTGIRMGSVNDTGRFAQLGININYNGSILILNAVGGDWENINSVRATPVNDLWHHVVLTCKKGSCTLFLDGEKVYSCIRSISSSKPGNYIAILCGLNEYLDEVRISDIVRYTSDFTPQDKPFSN